MIVVAVGVVAGVVATVVADEYAIRVPQCALRLPDENPRRTLSLPLRRRRKVPWRICVSFASHLHIHVPTPPLSGY